MACRKIYVCTIYLFLFQLVNAGEFKAYYTRLDYQDSISGKYADIVVELGSDRRVVFSREYSFLPYWQTDKGRWFFEEMVERQGDGTDKQPDKINRYTYVRLIKDSKNEVIVHWRYFPSFEKIGFTDVVHEYFKIDKFGKVTRKIYPGTETYHQWQNRYLLPEHKLELSPEGIHLISTDLRQTAERKRRPGSRSKAYQTNVPAKPRARINRSTKLDFTFDVRTENTVKEWITGEDYELLGNGNLFVQGVWGNAIHCDGYTTGVKIPALKMPKLDESFSIDGWVALGAYPFDWAPMFHQSQWSNAGYYLGIDQQGRAGFHVMVNDQWQMLIAPQSLTLFHWHHIAGVFDHKHAKLSLYVDGKLITQKDVGQGKVHLSDTDGFVGLNREKMPVAEGRIRKGKWPSLFGIDGLLDDVRVCGEPLDAATVLRMSKMLSQNVNRVKPDLEIRRFPAHPENQVANHFGAYYTRFNYHHSWDQLWRVGEDPDILVEFDQLPTHLIFWRGISSGPALITENGKWGGDQSSENYREIDMPGLAEGCCEFMSDKQCRHSHVRIIENHDARVVVHWRYGLVDSKYHFVTETKPEGDWADEYWTVYPDGVMVRHLARGKIWGDSWVETLFYNPPGTKPEDNIETQALTIINEEGKSLKLSWQNGSPNNQLIEDHGEPVITMTNLKSKYRPFNVYPTGSGVEIFGGHARRSKFHWWNHFPVSQIASDGREARFKDRSSHSSLVWGAPSKDWLMYGFSNQSPQSLMPLAKSWNAPAEIKNTKGCKVIDYLQQERAYHMESKSNSLEFLIAGSVETPILNPCFVIQNWGKVPVTLELDGKRVEKGETLRYGYRTTDDGIDLVVWLKLSKKDLGKIKMYQ